jgi:hypothetical protein
MPRDKVRREVERVVEREAGIAASQNRILAKSHKDAEFERIDENAKSSAQPNRIGL